MDYQNIQIFEELAEEYDAWFDRHCLAHESELQALKRWVPPVGKGLEIGVGSGRFALPLGVRVGVEPAGAMARIARKRGLEVLRADAGKLPFKSEAYDFVLIVTVLCFLPDPPGALREATRVLKPQGRIVIGMIDRDSPLGQFYEAKKQESKFYRHARFYPVKQVLEWLRSLGYESLATCQTIFQTFPEITGLEPVKEGHGEGGFVVISAQKANP
ncbi:MAG: class I SAM-dependent methyltransferase [Thermodesulfobacteriota bacterium]